MVDQHGRRGGVFGLGAGGPAGDTLGEIGCDEKQEPAPNPSALVNERVFQEYRFADRAMRRLAGWLIAVVALR